MIELYSDDGFEPEETSISDAVESVLMVAAVAVGVALAGIVMAIIMLADKSMPIAIPVVLLMASCIGGGLAVGGCAGMIRGIQMEAEYGKK